MAEAKEINKYIKYYSEVYSKIPESKQKKKEALIRLLAENSVQADECKAHLEKEGCVSEMPQGKYSITRINPWSQAYDAKMKTIQSLMDKLDKLEPDAKIESAVKAGDNLAKFIMGGKPVESH